MSPSHPQLELDTLSGNDVIVKQERDRVREVYRARLAEKLKDPEFRKIEGFPIGTDEAILALSDPPFYTACPNPFLEEWLAENATSYDAATDDYHREPFAADVSEGKNDPIYNAHSYHTKVPHKAIMRYILHYTEPGNVVYDGFCGTGMTGVAAQMCGNKAQVESLGYTVQEDGAILDTNGQQISRLGARKAILNDLSPAATFIAYNYNTPVNAAAFESEARRILAEVEAEYGWMYATLHDATPEETARISAEVRASASVEDLRQCYNGLKSIHSPLRARNSILQLGRINFIVWSDVFMCSSCGSEITFWDVAVDTTAKKISDTFVCPSCGAETTKRQSERAMQSHFDQANGHIVTQAKQVPVLLNYSIGKKRFEKPLDEQDRALISAVSALPNHQWFPSNDIPFMHVMHERNRLDAVGVTNIHHFYTPQNLYLMAVILDKFKSQPRAVAAPSILAHSAANLYCSRLRRYRPDGKGGGPLSGTIYLSSIITPPNVILSIGRNAKTIAEALAETTDFPNWSILSTNSCHLLAGQPETVDYIFTDPPFGDNLQYSELNLIWESWLRVTTNNMSEAVMNGTQKKFLREYQALMTYCFANYFRLLKPGRWMTVEFHNSANAVWNAIQEALEHAGFIVADVRVIDKKQGSFNQVTSGTAVKSDLVISCYKPRADFEQHFQQLKGKPEGVLEFLRQHLFMLPVAPVTSGHKLEPVVERTRFLLFDRMIAYHLQRGAPIPMDSAAFYKLLEDQFTTRDEMYFLPDQAARYDALKSRGYETEQLSIFLQDEKSAVQWVRAALTETPQTLGDLTPKFMQELREWPAHEPRPELRDLLREYFVQGDGVWRVPNPDDEKDIEALRNSALLRLFQGYTREKGALKTFRKEAVTEGFKQCYETNQYGVIVAVCEKIPEKVFQEIPEFVMFYDIAKDMVKDLAPERVEQTEFVWE